MITLSNADAVKLLKYATDQLEILTVNHPRKGSTVAINEVRRLRILLRKIKRKLDKASPGILNNNKQSNNNGKTV